MFSFHMTPMRALTLSLAIPGLIATVHAQEPPRARDYGSTVLTSVAGMDKSTQLAEMLTLLATVPQADSLYERVLVQRTGLELARDSFGAALAAVELGIREQGKLEWLFHYEKIACLSGLKQYAAAVAYADSCIARYPGSQRFPDLKAKVVQDSGDKARALALFEENVRRFPASADAHAALGNMARQEGKTAQAALCYSMALCLHRGAKDDTRNLNILDQMLGGTLDHSPEGVDLGKQDDFSEIDLLLQNKVAMEKGYKVKPDLPYAMCRQSHLLFTWLTKNDPGNGFWSEFYVPFFKTLMKEDLFEGFVYNALASADNEKVQSIALKNKSKVLEFDKRFWRLFMEQYQTYPDSAGAPAVQHWYGDDGNITGVGKGDMATSLYTGPWTRYNDNGSVASRGVLSAAGKRTGHWMEYYDNGAVERSLGYDEGNEDGTYLRYHRSGALDDSLRMDKGTPDGQYDHHDVSGTMLFRKTFTGGKLTGPGENRFACNTVENSFNLVDDKAEGHAVAYYPDGVKQYEGDYKAGVRTGLHSNWYHNGNKQNESTYVDGQAEGPFRKWWPDGTLKEKGAYTGGNLTGVDSTWDEDGSLSSVGNYDDKGRSTGIYRSYDKGRLYMELEYAHDLLLSYRYLDRDGKVLGEGRRKQGKFQFVGYSTEGDKLSAGSYLDEGAKDGTWTYYAADGTVSRTQEFDKGKQQGTDHTFYENGKPKEDSQCNDGDRTGEYREYYLNGKPRFIGWMVKNDVDGSYRHYLPDGTLIEDEYFAEGTRDGWQHYYDHLGRPASTVRVVNGVAQEKFIYGPDGALLQHYVVPPGPFVVEEPLAGGGRYCRIPVMNGTFHGKATWYYPDGTVLCEGSYLNGKRDGTWTWYHPNGRKDSESQYANGDQVGVEKNWWRDGKLSNEDHYENGETNGTFKSWWPNGKLRSEVMQADGVYHGTMKNFASDGTPQLIRYFDRGLLIGYASPKAGGGWGDTVKVGTGVVEVKGTYPDGRPSRSLRYRNGRLDGTYRSFGPNGKVEEEETYEAGKAQGEDRENWPDGSPRVVRHYVEGMLHGSYKVFAANGTVTEECNYVYGDIDGEQHIRDEHGKMLTITYANGVAVKMQR